MKASELLELSPTPAALGRALYAFDVPRTVEEWRALVEDLVEEHIEDVRVLRAAWAEELEEEAKHRVGIEDEHRAERDRLRDELRELQERAGNEPGVASLLNIAIKGERDELRAELRTATQNHAAAMRALREEHREAIARLSAPKPRRARRVK